jgi:hypothetical protein
VIFNALGKGSNNSGMIGTEHRSIMQTMRNDLKDCRKIVRVDKVEEM